MPSVPFHSPTAAGCRVAVRGLLAGLALAVFGCAVASAPKSPEPEPTEMELKIRMIETSKQLVAKGATKRDRAFAELELEYWMRRFDEETGKVTEPAFVYPGPLRTAEDYIAQAYWVRIRGLEAYEDLMLTDPTFGPSPEARKGIARRRGDAERMVGNLTRMPDGAAVPEEARQWQGEVLGKRRALWEAGPAAWQKPLLEEIVNWWEKFGKTLAKP